MSGNAWEWCSDIYGDYQNIDQKDPKGASNGDSRVMRGGSCFSKDSNCCVSNRGFGYSDSSDETIGFRVVVD